VPPKAVSEKAATAAPLQLTTKDEDTIAAIVTGTGDAMQAVVHARQYLINVFLQLDAGSVVQGSVAIIRVSGTDAFKVALGAASGCASHLNLCQANA
jgi:hypothetical protein